MGVAGVFFGLLVGWIIGSQQGAGRPPAPGGRAAPRASSAAAGAPAGRRPLDESRASAMKTDGAAEPDGRRHARAARQHVLRRRALPGSRRVVRGGAEDQSEGRQRQHRSRHRLLLHEPGRQGAGAVRSLARRSTRRTPRRCSTSASSARSASRISRARPRPGRRCSPSRPAPKRRARRSRRSTASSRRTPRRRQELERHDRLDPADCVLICARRPRGLIASGARHCCDGLRGAAGAEPPRRRRWSAIRSAAPSSCPSQRPRRSAPARRSRFFCSENCRRIYQVKLAR